MPRKGTRLITVAGVEYRWLLSNRQSLCVADCDIIVELADAPIGKLLTKPAAIDQWFGDDYDYAVTPALIETGIRSAIANGWVPGDPGTFRLPYRHHRAIRRAARCEPAGTIEQSGERPGVNRPVPSSNQASGPV